MTDRSSGAFVRHLAHRLATTVAEPLDRVRTHRNTDKRGTFRWYDDYRLPEPLGGGVVTVRLHANGEDAKRMHVRRQGLAPPQAA
jgi:hypothetical protein